MSIAAVRAVGSSTQRSYLIVKGHKLRMKELDLYPNNDRKFAVTVFFDGDQGWLYAWLNNATRPKATFLFMADIIRKETWKMVCNLELVQWKTKAPATDKTPRELTLMVRSIGPVEVTQVKKVRKR